MTNGKKIILAVAVAALAAGAWWGISGKNRAAIMAGGQVYANNCASCHGANLEGQPDWRIMDENGMLPAPPHDVSGHTWHHGDTLLFDYVKFGGDTAMKSLGITDFESGMPAFEQVLTDVEINQTLDYIKSNWTEREVSFQREVTLTDE